MENTAVLEKVLLGFLQFDDEFFTAFVLAVQIENRLAIHRRAAELLVFQVGEIDNLALFMLQQGIQKVPQQVLVRFFAKQAFEAIVGEKLT
ncbi:hypothetical protein Thiowin_01568 [Thiorhodovibrio winogradskyi]|uniref:Uncharacterized protein n=1 Tax=Thiorhodovibrio winogradskyi TaxID=77007 RepID=A0ABZ0S936_9GAMM